MHYFNVILKARQLGFSTFILIYMLDAALFNSNHQCGVIAQGLVEAQDLFDNKVKFAYDNLPDWLKDAIPLTADSARKLELGNNSSITVGTSLRGGTFQKLHVSEYGKIAARYPEKAREIKTGAFNTVHVGQQIFVESTAEGQMGEFYDLVMHSQRLRDEDVKLTPLDPKLHFYPWYENPNYRIVDTDNVSINVKDAEYFKKLKDENGINLDPDQQAWYVKRKDLMGDDMKREFPSTEIEAFEASLEGAYYQNEMRIVRKAGQISNIPWEPSIPVDTYWDLGVNDKMSIWFFQHVGREYRFIRYYSNSGEGFAHYANKLNDLGYVYGTHYMPWDGNHRTLGKEAKTKKEIAEDLGIRPIKIVPRTKSVKEDINLVRTLIPRCHFDAERCADGIISLDSYRKEWDDKNGVWKDKPRHDDASHGADAFRTWAKGFVGRVDSFDDTDSRQAYADSEYDYFY
jgi:hypothetical protein